MSSRNWIQPSRWQKEAEASGVRRRVFCGSMCDWADKNAPAGQLDRLWEVIRKTPLLDWQLLTKRASRIEKCLPNDWESGPTYQNVWLGVTVENIEHGLPRIEHLNKIPARVRFLSMEPLLEDIGEMDLNGINWVIVGGESGEFARPMNIEWAENILEQCRRHSVPFFFKQMSGKEKATRLNIPEHLKIREFPQF